MKTIKALIFDLDNTLLDRSKTFLNFSMKLITKYFTDLTDKEKQNMISQILIIDQDGYKEKKQMFLELLDLLPWNYKPGLEELLEFYTAEYVKNAILMDDAIEILEYLKIKYKIGLITNGKIIIQYGKLDKLDLRKYFDTIVVSEEAGIKKPNKRIFEIALTNLDLRPEECIYIGDHPVNDIDGADKAGMKTIWIKVNQPWKEELTVKPLKTITKLNELLELI